MHCKIICFPHEMCSSFLEETKRKIIHARYCDKFVHTLWKDGSVVHVYVTTEKYKQYEKKMRTALRQMEGRFVFFHIKSI